MLHALPDSEPWANLSDDIWTHVIIPQISCIARTMLKMTCKSFAKMLKPSTTLPLSKLAAYCVVDDRSILADARLLASYFSRRMNDPTNYNSHWTLEIVRGFSPQSIGKLAILASAGIKLSFDGWLALETAARRDPIIKRLMFDYNLQCSYIDAPLRQFARSSFA